jgi:hypothetical protein
MSHTYLKLDSMEYPLFQGDVRLRCPEMGETFFVPDGFVEVQSAVVPDIPADHYLVESPPVLIDGVWTQVLSVAAYTQEDLARLEAQKQEFELQIRQMNQPIAPQDTNQSGSPPDVIG